MFHAEIICDSISSDGIRLTTFEVEYPHAVHKDLMTHRMLSRNFKTYRGFPPEKIWDAILADPYVPEVWYERVKGMEDGDPITDEERTSQAYNLWAQHIFHCLLTAKSLNALGISKSQVNLPTQDLTWIRGVITATEWDNFFHLRTEINPKTGRPKARPEVAKIVGMMKALYEQEEPWVLQPGEWHLPYVKDYELYGASAVMDIREPVSVNWDFWKKISAARCGRVSFLTHDGVRDLSADETLHDSLLNDLHMSPFEHQATPIGGSDMHPANRYYWSGNFYGWKQYRKEIPFEANAGEKRMDLA